MINSHNYSLVKLSTSLLISNFCTVVNCTLHYFFIILCIASFALFAADSTLPYSLLPFDLLATFLFIKAS